ncbi:hypothetical protein [Sorangium sp. So ce233]
MLDVDVIDDPAEATAALEPVRTRLQSELGLTERLLVAPPSPASSPAP